MEIFEARVLGKNLSFWCVNKTQFSKLVIFQSKTKIFPQNPCFKYFHVRTNPLHQRFYTVFKVEYFLYIIQIMLQYTPSFNKVCYTLRLQGCVNKTQFSKLVIFQSKTKIFPQNPCFKYFHVRTNPR
jgi:hypothetical protein